jgi:bacillopeptidase F
MAGRYRLNKERNLSRFYILLSIIFVVIMFKWGVPFLMEVIAGKGTIRATQDEDIIPPQSPVLSALPEATNNASLLVEGYTETGAGLELLVNDTVSRSDVALENGFFSMQALLSQGSNRVYVKATDAAGNSSASEVKLVTFDNEPLEITVIHPRDGSEFFGKNSQVIDISGEVSKSEVQAVVNNSFLTVDKDGKFTHRYQLASGDNEIKVVATDKAGNMDEKTIKVLYTP